MPKRQRDTLTCPVLMLRDEATLLAGGVDTSKLTSSRDQFHGRLLVPGAAYTNQRRPRPLLSCDPSSSQVSSKPSSKRSIVKVQVYIRHLVNGKAGNPRSLRSFLLAGLVQTQLKTEPEPEPTSKQTLPPPSKIQYRTKPTPNKSCPPLQHPIPGIS